MMNPPYKIKSPRWLLLNCLMIITAVLGTSKHAFSDNQAVFEQSKRLGQGVNILGYDPIWRSSPEGRFRAEHFQRIRDAGFDHVRINLFPFRDAKPDGSLSDPYWKTLDWAVQQALKNHLAVILDFHEFIDMAEAPTAKKERFLALWKQIAERYKDAPDEVFFEILNEPNGRLTPELWNQFHREALAIIRETNPDRTVIIGPGHWNNIDALDKLELPDDDQNILITIHYYNPFEFTHQGTPWTDRQDQTGIVWQGTRQERQAVVDDFHKAQAWAEKNHRPLYLGEFSAYEKADMPSRLRWLDCVARRAEKMGWSWAYWQFDSDFVVYDIPRNRWIRPILDALIPPKVSSPFGRGAGGEGGLREIMQSQPLLRIQPSP